MPHLSWHCERYISKWRSQIVNWHHKNDCTLFMYKHILLRRLSSSLLGCIHSIITRVFFVDTTNIFSLVNQTMITIGIFFQQLCFGSFHLPPEHSSFKQKYLQGSVATHLRCDGIFKDHLTTNLLISVQMEKNQKSVKIWRSYRHEFGVFLFWDTVYNESAW